MDPLVRARAFAFETVLTDAGYDAAVVAHSAIGRRFFVRFAEGDMSETELVTAVEALSRHSARFKLPPRLPPRTVTLVRLP